jgi:hypothetical protein
MRRIAQVGVDQDDGTAIEFNDIGEAVGQYFFC